MYGARERNPLRRAKMVCNGAIVLRQAKRRGAHRAIAMLLPRNASKWDRTCKAKPSRERATLDNNEPGKLERDDEAGLGLYFSALRSNAVSSVVRREKSARATEGRG